MRRQIVSRLAIAVVLAATALAAAGCQEDDARPNPIAPLDTFVAETDAPGVYVAVITDWDRVAGFVTDGRRNGIFFATSQLTDGRADLFARDGQLLGHVTLTPDSASGEVTLGEPARRFGDPEPIGNVAFSGEPADGPVGLFVAAEKQGADSFEAGWIVLPDGSDHGFVTRFLDGEFTTAPAPPLDATVDIPGFGPQVPYQHTGVFFDTDVDAPG